MSVNDLKPFSTSAEVSSAFLVTVRRLPSINRNCVSQQVLCSVCSGVQMRTARKLQLP
jgi:hypothetical protein